MDAERARFRAVGNDRRKLGETHIGPMLGDQPLDATAPAPSARLANDLDRRLTDVGKVRTQSGGKPAYRRLGNARFPPNSVIRMAWQRGRTHPFRELGLGRNDGNLLWAEARSLE